MPSRSVSVIRSSRGFSLIEAMIVLGIIGISMMAILALQQQHLKMTNFVEYQFRKGVIEKELVGTFLNDPNNCACLFQGSAPFNANPTAPGDTLTGVSPSQIGRYKFVTPGVCAGATIPEPLVSTTGVENVKSTSIRIGNLMAYAPGDYAGTLFVDLLTSKEVSGPPHLQIRLPVHVTANVAGASASFVNCTTGTPTSGGCRFCARSCGNGYTKDSGIIAAHIKDWDYVYTLGISCTGAYRWDISDQIHLCCTN